MALITCPECGKRVSSVSKQCIYCGYPIGVIVRNHLVDNIILDATIEQLNLSIRSYKALRDAGIRTVRNLINLNAGQLISIKHFGKKSFKEIEERLLELGLRFCDKYNDYESDEIIVQATKLDWKCERAPKNTDYSHVMYAFHPKELEKLRSGCIPTSMEQKWFYYYDNGAISFYRSWTGTLVFRLILNEQTNNHILIRFYDDETKLDDLCHIDIIDLIRCLIRNS